MRTLIIIVMLLIARPVHAGATFCEMESYRDSAIASKILISWDEDAGSVKIKLPGWNNDVSHTGKIALVRTGGASQKILNFIFTGISDGSIIGPNSEFLIHESSPGEFVFFGINFVVVDGVKYLTGYHGMYTGKCNSV